VRWRDALLTLDSDGGRLVAIHESAKRPIELWRCASPCFLKGLAVVGTVPPSRGWGDAPQEHMLPGAHEPLL
jgi:hypothetical protein